ncbi:MAG: hypothetical protein SF029_15770 [bacterium]|nr:hypothetical protein [bacterium]
MNDELSAQLTLNWRIPTYARAALWIETDTGTVPLESEVGLFTLNYPAALLTLRWGSPDGPALARLPWKPDSLDWDGTVKMGGYVDAIHVTEIGGISYPVTVIYMGGQPLKASTSGFPDAALRNRPPYPAPEFYAGLAAEVGQSATTWLVPDESPMAAMAQHAMMNNLRLYFFGRLADDNSGWAAHFALPLLLQAATLFGP